MNNQPHIERYLGLDTLHPAIPAIGRSTQKRARSGLEAHDHQHYEVVLLEKGHVDWFCNGQRFSLGPGSLFLTRPEEVHGSPNGVIQPSSFSWIQLSPSNFPSQLQHLPFDPDWTQGKLDPGLTTLLGNMLKEIRHPSPHGLSMLEGLLIQFVITLSRCRGNDEAHTLSPSLQKVIEAVRDDPSHPWSNGELEQISGLKHAQLNRRFQDEVGQSPRAYALRLRLQEAHRLLRETALSITTVAYDLGFSNSQHLSSSFRKHFGVTPRECRQEKGF